MDYTRLFEIADRARTRQRPAPDDMTFVCETVPAALSALPKYHRPKSVRHPAGFTVSGAPVGTFLRSALLLAGRKALGDRYARHAFYERVEESVAFGITNAHFHGAPKGVFCCSQCTLALLPVLEARAIRYFDCAALAKEVRRIIEDRQWRFRGAVNAKMLDWSLGRGAPLQPPEPNDRKGGRP